MTPGTDSRADGRTRQAGRRVSWIDGTFRADWTCRYSTAGATMRSVPSATSAAMAAANCWVATRGKSQPSAAGRQLIVATLRKILQRGTAPPIDPRSERTILGQLGLTGSIPGSGSPDDISVRLEPRTRRDFIADPIWCRGGHGAPDSDLRFDSDFERWFLCEWVPATLGADAISRIIPQAPLDVLAPQATKADDAQGRRCDFLMCPPLAEQFIVELDGPQHATQEAIDRARDDALWRAGFRVIRVCEETRAAALSEVQASWGSSNPAAEDGAGVVWGATQLHRLVLALLDAVQAGFLTGSVWNVRVDDPTGLAVPALTPYLDLMLALDTLWAGSVIPLDITVDTDAGARRFQVGARGFEACPVDTPSRVDVLIRLEPHLTGTNLLEPSWEYPAEIVVRSTSVPLALRDPISAGAGRPELQSDRDDAQWALTVVLRSVFAKQDFREGQIEAILEAVNGRDCCVLLPTGAGKSLIYQMVGLCTPGRTLVVDPLVALMEDQVRRLAEDGIDRTAMITAETAAGGARAAIERAIAGGDALFTFVSPERLQQASFRTAIHELAVATPINLAVVDEAHCVSEWGHDFRPAYLDLGRKLREMCRGYDSNPPPLLALTGTASRAVLRDVLIELGIDRESDRSLVRPTSFDRKELSLRVRRTTPQDARGGLRGALRAAAEALGLNSETQLFTSQGDATPSGLVFCPHVNGRWGAREVADDLAAMSATEIPIFAGTAPRGMDPKTFQARKRENAAAFIGNDRPILVATNAFGMGIDKPNIRHLVHFGMPGSIEAYYQQVGRAGRDGASAYCTLLLVEDNERASRRLLDEEIDHNEAQTRFKRQAGNGDVGRQLYFLYGSFPGADAELAVVESLISELGHLGEQSTVGISMANSSGTRLERERGLHRLVVLGVLDGYDVQFGSNAYQAHLRDVDSRGVLGRLLAYVGRSQPARVEPIRRSIADAEDMSLNGAVYTCAAKLIAFIYDTVARSRRRAVREMWLAANEGTDDEARFRARILAYLTHGEVVPKLEALIELHAFAYSDLIELLEDGGLDEDIGELRGAAARMLEAAPDHPALLFARGYSELLDFHGSLPDCVTNLEASFRSARDRYGAAADDVERAVAWLLARAGTLREGGDAAILSAARRASIAQPTVRAYERGALTVGGDAGTLVFALAAALDDALALTSASTDGGRNG